jgi:hypothetical protein
LKEKINLRFAFWFVLIVIVLPWAIAVNFMNTPDLDSTAEDTGVAPSMAQAKTTVFIDPTALEIGATYTLSKRTPIMPSYEVSDLSGIVYANPGDSITITRMQMVRNIVWYQVERGWVNSTALIGQDLKN